MSQDSGFDVNEKIMRLIMEAKDIYDSEDSSLIDRLNEIKHELWEEMNMGTTFLNVRAIDALKMVCINIDWFNYIGIQSAFRKIR